MDIRMLVRLGAVVVVAATAAIAAVEFGREDGSYTKADQGQRTKDRGVEDPLGPMLVRCIELGDAAIRDAGCRKTWMENRRRFLGAGPQSQAKPPRPQGAASAPLPDASKTGVADDNLFHGTDEKAVTPAANINNDNSPADAGKDAAKIDGRPRSDPLAKPRADDQTEAK